ncbi:hypothetical protein M434DRAFT_395478 [Hypoxylon sp. CO27-5]|nr:hypothetical protein M434DRAFT_395478 [Hypoxylon sp. CO27-5]
MGTVGYKAPEVFCSLQDSNSQNTEPNIDRRSFYTCKADLWSLGCVIYRMAKGEPLFNSDPEMMNEKTHQGGGPL